MEQLLMKATSHTAFWIIKYYLATLMFSRVIWYLMGSCKTNIIKIHQGVQRRFGLKLKKNAFTLSTCSKNTMRRILQHSFQWMPHSDLHISLHSYCDHHEGKKGSWIFMPSQDLKTPFFTTHTFLKKAHYHLDGL
jgi:hypothetical protein